MKKVAATSGQSVSFATRFFRVEIACAGYWVGRDRELNFYFSSSERHSLSRRGEASSHSEEYKSHFCMQQKSALQANYFIPYSEVWMQYQGCDHRCCPTQSRRASTGRCPCLRPQIFCCVINSAVCSPFISFRSA